MFALPDRLEVFVSHEFGRKQLAQQRLLGGAIGRSQVFAHLLSHENAVRADIDDSALLEQPVDQFLDLGINQGLTATNRDHWGIAFLGRPQAILKRHHVLEAG
ncbi:hypothetical protein SDC9_200709 [bioreactor metagenome]|uniref:Uncharacterized protein n=1 Tax=bioreactor metagenome TaxID=1076179 RepID=A0A645IPP4_9ZZZZ